MAKRLQPGDEIRVIAPSKSLEVIKGKQKELAVSRLNQLGFTVSFGKNTEGHDEFFSSSIEDRVEDIHEAFRDPRVKGILTAIGGYNSNQLLKALDYQLISEHPKILCGYSDITALSNAIYQKTGLITYSGPHFSSFGMKEGFDYTLQSFLNAVTNDAPYEVSPSPFWSDDPWYMDQDKRTYYEQHAYLVLGEGNEEGTLIGGNLGTLNLLQGTEFMPPLNDSIVFIEDDEESHPAAFDRGLQSLLHLPDASGIKVLLIGRFQKASGMTETALKKIIASKMELNNIPVIANVNFGHTDPFATIPVGARATVTAGLNGTEITIDQKKIGK